MASRGPEAAQRTLDGLRHLEYRGYDSAGLGVRSENGLSVIRAEGKLAYLVDKIGADPRPFAPSVTVAIGHTRWATHGAVDVDNAHPIVDCTGQVAIVHNGVLDNYAALRSELEFAGHTFAADVDSEVIAHLVEQSLCDGLTPLDALRKTVARLQGSWAIAMLVGSVDALFLARYRSPLLVRGDCTQVVVASDARATDAAMGPLRSLDDGDVVELGDAWRWAGGKGDGKLPDVLAESPDALVHLPAVGELGGTSAMEREIAEQAPVARGLVERLRLELATNASWELVGVPSPRSVHILACGSSLYAAEIVARTCRLVAGIPAVPIVASEYDPHLHEAPDLTIAVSQSGETADVLAALDKVSSPVIAITNNPWSSLALCADAVLDCAAGIEHGVAATKTFTAQVIVGVGLVLSIARDRITDSAMAGYLDSLDCLPHQLEVADLLSRQSAQMLAEELVEAPGWIYLGTGSGLPYAAEGALKMKELTYRWAQSYPAAELKHGPLALVSAGTPVVVVDNGAARLATSIAEVQSRGARVIRIGGQYSDIGPPTNPDEPLWGQLAVVPSLQHLALQVASVLGNDIDHPRNLAKSVTVL